MIILENELCKRDCDKISLSKKLLWTNKKLQDDDDFYDQSPVSVRRSRKSTTLNNPVAFTTFPTEQSTIKRLMVIPTGGCCDMDYKLAQKNESVKPLSTRKSTPKISYPPSITINIGPTMPFHLNPTMANYNPLTSFSNLSTTQNMITEEKWEPNERIIPSEHSKPKLLVDSPHHHNSEFPRTISKEQKIIDLETSQGEFFEHNLVYSTKYGSPPKITPFKSCWNCLKCKKKGKKDQDEVYFPSTSRNQQTRKVIVYPAYSRGTSFDSRFLEPNIKHQMNFVPSKLSTITESQSSHHTSSQESLPKVDKKV